MEKAVIGLDIGTSSIKIIVCNFNKKIIYSDKEEFSKEISDVKTINPYGLLDKVTEILSRTIEKKKKIEVKAIGLSSMFPSLVALDNNGKPITEIFTWLDKHGSSIVEEFKKNKEEANKLYKKTGCVVHESYPLWKILWLKKHKKSLFSKADKFVSLSEYLTYKLTGKFIVSKAIASTTGFYNIFSEEWDKSILDMLGIGKKKISECYDIYHSEKINKEFCSTINVENAVLVLGAGDGLLSHVGSGCLKKKGMSSTVGTSGALRLISDKAMLNNPLIWCYYLDKDKYVIGGAINAGLISLNWFKEKVKGDDDFFKEMDEAVVKRKIDGAYFLPFLDGERGPGYNQNINACFVGLSSKDDYVSIYRSILEGIFFNLYSCYEVIVKEVGIPLEIRASGGYINSDVMLQMQADIFNKEISVPDVKQSSALGAAIIALKSIGQIKDILEFEVGIKKKKYPDSKKHKMYMKRYKVYKELYKLLVKKKKNKGE